MQKQRLQVDETANALLIGRQSNEGKGTNGGIHLADVNTRGTFKEARAPLLWWFALGSLHFGFRDVGVDDVSTRKPMEVYL